MKVCEIPYRRYTIEEGRAAYAAVAARLDGAKSGTDLAADYEAGTFQTLAMEDYFRLLCGCIERMPPAMVIHRMTGDGAKRDLIAPLWSADKKTVLNTLRRYMTQHDVRQGRLFEGED